MSIINADLTEKSTGTASTRSCPYFLLCLAIDCVKIRLSEYDYSASGAYFITVCVKDKQIRLSEIVETVGDGAFDVPKVRLTDIGQIVEKNMLSSERISGVKIEKYVIMPDHIHAIIVLDSEKFLRRQGTSKAPSPTNEMLPHIVSTFKRFCNKEVGANVFQRSYMEHIIRDFSDFETKWNYICDNPRRWIEKRKNPHFYK